MLFSGATSHKIKDESLFIEYDWKYTGKITNANSSKISIEGRGTIEIKTENSKGCERKIRLTMALFVPDNSKYLVSVIKQRAADDEVLFGKDSELITINGTVFLFEDYEIVFLWKTVNSTDSENCNLAVEDQLNLCYKCLRHNIIEDLLKSKDHSMGLKTSEPDVSKCATCQIYKSRKIPVPKQSRTRAKDVLEIVHTGV